MNPLEINWDKIASELEEELGRNPTSEEIQKRLSQKFWDMVDIIEENRLEDNNELV